MEYGGSVFGVQGSGSQEAIEGCGRFVMTSVALFLPKPQKDVKQRALNR